MNVIIRQASPEDADAIYHMINGLSVYSDVPLQVVPDADQIRRSLFAPDSTAEAYICEIEGTIAGYCVISMSFLTWRLAATA